MTDTYWPWDEELGQPVHYRPMYYCDWDTNLDAALKAYWSAVCAEIEREDLPYWGA
jgi:5-methylcytosine-specific restriction endonuclease McrA